MQTLSRRRFLTISAAATGLIGLPARAEEIYEWRGIALGAEAAIYLAHPDAQAITERAALEIARMEGIFSLYRSNSALAQLNAQASLDAPPFELLECLSLCSQVHSASMGAFDPTVQPLWSLYAARYSAGTAPTPQEIDAARALVGWSKVSFSGETITLQPGMALTLNGVAQGWIADHIAKMLRDEGLGNVLVNTGEFHGVGRSPNGKGWPVTLAEGGKVELENRGLATSSALGTVFDSAGRIGHILDPRSGLPARGAWSTVSVSAPTAALADAISTAICLMQTGQEVEAFAAQFDGVTVEALA